MLPERKKYFRMAVGSALLSYFFPARVHSLVEDSSPNVRQDPIEEGHV